MTCTLKNITYGNVSSIAVVPTLRGNYYSKKVASTTKIDLALSGTYNNYTVPPGLNITVGVTHAIPFSIDNPFNFTKCSAKIVQKKCLCAICGNESSGIAVDCSNQLIITTPPIYFPNTSNFCIDMKYFV
jgi:hypothetical protein